MKLKPEWFVFYTVVLLSSCSTDQQSLSAGQNHTSPSESRSDEIPLDENRYDEIGDHSVQWFPAQRSQKITGVALVIHGLNLRPEKMGPIINCLNASGIDVLNLSLRGHGENYAHNPRLNHSEARLEAFKTVSSSLWVDEVRRACRHARKRCDQQNVPLFFIGFSLGALLGCDLLATEPNVHFDRMVLFAPAFNCTICNLLKIFILLPRLVIPSLSSKSYLANWGTPMAGYIALFDTIEHFKQHVGPELNVPTIIFIDRQDEFVSYRGLKRMVATKKLDRWNVHFVKKEKTGVQVKLHHLIIDEHSLGKKNWNDVKKEMIRHFLQ